MDVLIANLGSTSFKHSLYRFDGGAEGGGVLIAKGGQERVSDHREAIDICLAELTADGHLAGPPDAVGFKTVLGRNLSGCVPADDAALAALDGFADVAPAHNPPYAAGIRAFAARWPDVPRYALFETAFYQWVPEAASRYAVPESWHNIGIRRYGFHGASHKFIAERSAALLDRHDVARAAARLYVDGPAPIGGPPCRVISCHLGGSSSVTGIRNGVAIGTSMGFSPQSGVPQNNRVGDLDPMAIAFARQHLGLTEEEALRQLSKEAGLLGLSGVSNDIRDIAESAESGDTRAQLALDVFVHEIRRWIGSFLIELGGLDALVFTGGIGENRAALRAAICANLEGFGLNLDPAANDACRASEADLATPSSPARAFVIPANEELVVATEVARQLTARAASIA